MDEELTEMQKKILRDLEKNSIKVESVFPITNKFCISYAGAYRIVKALVEAGVVKRRMYRIEDNKIFFGDEEIGSYSKILSSEYYSDKFFVTVESDGKYKWAVYESGKLLGETKEHDYIKPLGKGLYEADRKTYHLDDILEELIK